MELIWSKEIPNTDFGHFHHECKPFIYGHTLFYAFYSTDWENLPIKGNYGVKITVMEVNLNNTETTIKHIQFKDKEPKGKTILLTKDWNFILREEKVYLYIGFLLEISQSTLSIASINYHQEEFKIKSDYDFGDKILKYNQRSKIECFNKSTHNKMWQATLKGFIYTNIELKNNCLLFGTAGQGGAFYCINLETGQVLTEHVNGSASNYTWQDNSIILKDLKGNLEQIDPYTGEILQTLILKDKLFYAPILAHNQHIYTTAYNKKCNSGVLICVRNQY